MKNILMFTMIVLLAAGAHAEMKPVQEIGPKVTYINDMHLLLNASLRSPEFHCDDRFAVVDIQLALGKTTHLLVDDRPDAPFELQFSKIADKGEPGFLVTMKTTTDRTMIAEAEIQEILSDKNGEQSPGQHHLCRILDDL